MIPAPGKKEDSEVSDSKNNHGRIDTRRAAIKAVTPVDADLVSAPSAIKGQGEWVERTSPEAVHQHTSSFISSLSPDQAERHFKAVREQTVTGASTSPRTSR